MKSLLATILVAMMISGCSSVSSRMGAATSGTPNPGTVSLTDDEKHRLYSAGLAASESPLDTALFKDVCKKIGIFDADGTPNDNYMPFVTAHFEWSTSAESEEFRRQINTREKAKVYLEKHLPK